MSLSPVKLAWRVLRVDRRTRLSAILTALGVAVATALVLLLVSLPFATKARAARTLWQTPDYTADNTNATVSWSFSQDTVDGQTITRIDVAPLTDPASVTLPPGIDKLPGPGEMLRSPELAELADGRPAEELADRFGAKPVGTLGEDALAFPEQLAVLVGHTPDTMPANAMKLPELAAGTAEADSLLSLLAGVGVVVLLIPSLVLVASASRLTAARREKRLAAFRLAGATPAQVTKMVAAETGIAAVAGAVLGVAVSPLFARLATFVPWAGGTWQASDFTLSVGLTVLLALVIPVLVVGAAMAGLRRVVASPLMATGGHTSKQPKAIRLLLIPVAGILFLLSLQSNGSNGLLPMLLALGLLMWSPTLVGPWLTSALGGLFVRIWRRPAALLAGRRLRDDPRAAYRASAGVVLAAFAGSMALTVMPSLENEAGYYSEFREPVLYLATDAERAPDIAEATDEKLAEYGVDARASVVSQVLLTDGDTMFLSALVAPCAEAERLLPVNVRCADTPAVYTPFDTSLAGVGFADPSEPSRTEPATQLPADAPVRPLRSANSTAVIDPALVPAGVSASEVFVAVPTDRGTREATRTALLAASGGEQVVSKETELLDQNTELADLRRVTVIGLVTASLLAGVSAAIATAGSVMERRRTFGALMAAGTPVRTLARALRTEAALPALIATVGAGALGTAVGVGLFGLVSVSLPTFTPWLAAPIALGALVAVIAASVCTPALNRVRAEPLADE